LRGAFHGQSVACEGVLRMSRKELLENGAARFLGSLGHGVSWVSTRKRVL
jgi:hypothetical protein